MEQRGHSHLAEVRICYFYRRFRLQSNVHFGSCQKRLKNRPVADKFFLPADTTSSFCAIHANIPIERRRHRKSEISFFLACIVHVEVTEMTTITLANMVSKFITSTISSFDVLLFTSTIWIEGSLLTNRKIVTDFPPSFLFGCCQLFPSLTHKSRCVRHVSFGSDYGDVRLCRLMVVALLSTDIHTFLKCWVF